MRSLTDLGSALATYGGLPYLVSLHFRALWVVSIQIDFSYPGCTIHVHIIHHYSMKDTLQYSSLHSCDSISLLLSIFPMYACENDLSRNIYFMFFLIEYFLISLEILFLQGIIAQGLSSSREFWNYLFSLVECIQSPIPLWRRTSLACNIFS